MTNQPSNEPGRKFSLYTDPFSECSDLLQLGDDFSPDLEWNVFKPIEEETTTEGDMETPTPTAPFGSEDSAETAVCDDKALLPPPVSSTQGSPSTTETTDRGRGFFRRQSTSGAALLKRGVASVAKTVSKISQREQYKEKEVQLLFYGKMYSAKIPKIPTLKQLIVKESEVVQRLKEEFYILLDLNGHPKEHAKVLESDWEDHVEWITRPKAKQSTLTEYFAKMRFKLCLQREISNLQAALIEVVREHGAKEVSSDLLLLPIARAANSSLASLPPIIQPSAEDFKMAKLDFKTMCRIKCFIFDTTTRPDPTSRIELSAALDQENFAKLLKSPEDYFSCALQYTLISAPEAASFLFCHDVKGDRVAPRCPCGGKVNQRSAGYLLHPEDCAFKRFADREMPGFIRDGVVSEIAMKALSPRERDYLCELLVKRLPTLEWKKSGLENRLLLNQNGLKAAKVIAVEKPSAWEMHQATCCAKQGCRTCTH